MNAELNSRQSRPRHKRFFRRHIIALSVVSLIILLAIASIVWILLTQNKTQSSFLIGIIVGIVAVVFAPTSWYIWIIESSNKSAEHHHDAQHQEVPTVSSFPTSQSQASSSPLPVPPLIPETPAVSEDNRQPNGASEGNEADALSGETPFQVGHPLSADAVTYIERQADQDALRHLQKMEYIALIDARHQGKSSLIYHLMRRLSKQNYTFVMFDLSEQKFQNKSEEEWYLALGTSFLQDLDFLQSDTQLPLPRDSTSWEFFLRKIAEASSLANQKMVIILDEVREIPSSYATPFFTVIRMVFNQRPLHPHYKYLTFIISGTFNPDELIRDKQVSKFIAQRIPLDDFDLVRVKQLVAHLHLSEELTNLVAGRIHYWTDGQPYLTQRICQFLSSQVMPHTHQELNDLIDRMGRQLYDDQHYLRRIKRLREKDPELFQYAQGIAYDNRPFFSSGLLEAHFSLAYIYGVIKADGEGRCQIRNRICEHALTRIITQSQQ
jgi:hypothetical protein